MGRVRLWLDLGVVVLAMLIANGSIVEAADDPAPIFHIERGPPQPRSAAVIGIQNIDATCPAPQIAIMPMSAGRSAISINSPCRQSESVRLQYAGLEFIRKLDQQGQLTFILDCMAGDTPPLKIVFSDGDQYSRQVKALDLERVTKLAVVWSAPVNLDLHAFEYSGSPQSDDHIWAGAPSTADESLGKTTEGERGHGFMSTTSLGDEAGTKLEVYTFWHRPGQGSGVINLALDYESRAKKKRDIDTCGTGLFSDLEYEAFLLARNAPAKRYFRAFTSIECSVTLTGIDRFNHKSLPQIFIRN